MTVSQPTPTTDAVYIRAVGGPTAIVTIGGLQLVTDPTFDPPGLYETAAKSGRFLEKTEWPALTDIETGPADAILLSHDQHVDNLDALGRAYALRSPVIFTTQVAAERLGIPAVGLANWQVTTLEGADGRTLEVMGVPAQHGPDGTDHLTGPVTGFVVSGDDVQTVYLSGDNVALALVAKSRTGSGESTSPSSSPVLQSPRFSATSCSP